MRRLDRWNREDEGVALVLVVGLTLVMSLFLIATLNFTLGSSRQVRKHDDWNRSISAADSGIDDLIYRMNQNPDYYLLSDADNDALSGWSRLSGSAESEEEFHYSIDSTEVNGQGRVIVTATGRVDGELRTVEGTLVRRGFLDYLQLTDVFTVDPWVRTDVSYLKQVYAYSCDHRQGSTWNDSTEWSVPRFEYDVFGNINPTAGIVKWGGFGTTVGRIDRATAIAKMRARYGDNGYMSQATVIANGLYCPDYVYSDGQTISGPVHSNDAIKIYGTTPGQPVFGGSTTSSYEGPDNPVWLDESGTSTPSFAEPFGYDIPVAFPPSNRTLIDRTDPGEGGCKYVGPTSIELRANALFIKSPLTPTAGLPAHCVPAGGGVVGGGTVSLLAPAFNGVIYVDSASGACPGAHPIGMPIAGDITTYGCTDGDVFVWGELDGAITIGADHDIVIAHDITYAGDDDLLGLIADSAVWLYHPVDAAGNNLNVTTSSGSRAPYGASQPESTNSTWESPMVNAAIVTLKRSLSLQNYRHGDPLTGTFTLSGAVASPFNGVTAELVNGVVDSGYGTKTLSYDTRLTYLVPPFFIEPDQSAWRQDLWREIDNPPFCVGAETPQVDRCLPA